MVLMSRKPICGAERAETMMDIFAGRASAEFERRQHELAMKKTDLLFRQVTDNIAPMVYVATPGLAEFHYVSAPFVTMWGHPPGQLLQQPQLWFDCIHPDDRARLQECAQSSRGSDTHSCEFRIVHATTGAEKWVRDRGWKIWPADGDPRVVGIVEDISLERQALEHLEKARQMAEEASTAKTLFLANISHGPPLPTPHHTTTAILGIHSCHVSLTHAAGAQRFVRRCRESWECWSCWTRRRWAPCSGTTCASPSGRPTTCCSS
jgi:PAS domain S-box-containing protein